MISGELGDRFAVMFEGMELVRVAGTTILTGVLDQAQLHGLIDRTKELGLELISVEPVPSGQTGQRANGG